MMRELIAGYIESMEKVKLHGWSDACSD